MIKEENNSCFIEVLDSKTEPIQVDLLVSDQISGIIKSLRTDLLLSQHANLCPLGVKVPTSQPEDVKAKLDTHRSKVRGKKNVMEMTV